MKNKVICLSHHKCVLFPPSLSGKSKVGIGNLVNLLRLINQQLLQGGPYFHCIPIT